MNDLVIYLHEAMVSIGLTESHVIGIPLVVLSVMAYLSYQEQEKERTAVTEHSQDDKTC